jgi:hypothetical protein
MDGARVVLREIADLWDPSADKDLSDTIQTIIDAVDARRQEPDLR